MPAIVTDLFTTYIDSPVGSLRIRGTEEFISEVAFREVSEDAPASEIVPVTIQQCIDQLQQYFDGGRRVFDLPLNQPGTSFQQQTWLELQQIDFGKTISYLDLALRLGDRKATRAVANANGKNNIAIIVPCHRVIGSDASLTGYAGGLPRKKWLLDHEKKAEYGIQTLF